MSVAYHIVPEMVIEPPSVAPTFPLKRPLHRLKEVRQQEQVSRASMARRLKTTVHEIAAQEEESSDLLLSTLYEWQKALDVPVSELLVESDETLSAPIMRRAQLLRIMKTTMTILERSRQSSIRHMAQTLADQLTEMMPELKGASPWPAVGKRRSRREVGLAVRRGLAATFLRQVDEPT